MGDKYTIEHTNAINRKQETVVCLLQTVKTRFYVFHTMRRIIAEINFPIDIYLIIFSSTLR